MKAQLSAMILVFACSLSADEFDYLRSTNYTTDSARSMPISDVKKSVMDMRGEIVRAEVASIYALTQVASETYVVWLYGKDGEPAFAVFHADGFKHINSLVHAFAPGKAKVSRLYVYIPDDQIKNKLVDDLKQLGNKVPFGSPHEREISVIAVGKTKKRGMNNTVEYKW